MEKFLTNPRHIEIQVLGDGKGHAIHLGERDCSIQRRHQKLIEVSPSLLLTPALRETMGNAAVTAAKAVEYDTVGTIEFLVDEELNLYTAEVIGGRAQKFVPKPGADRSRLIDMFFGFVKPEAG